LEFRIQDSGFRIRNAESKSVSDDRPTGRGIVDSIVPIYLDYNATAPLCGAAADVVIRALREQIGNASSVHRFGQQAKAALDDARDQVAALINGDAAEMVFTSGGTEADNLAIRGAAQAQASAGRRRVVVAAIEHEAVVNTAKALARDGWPVTVVPARADGVIDLDALRDALDAQTAVVSLMLANNETGVIQPVAECARLARTCGALSHTDAVQAVGRIPVDVRALGVDMLSLSGHKFGGPKGTGVLWVRRGVTLTAQQTGGRQERGRRAGTENVPSLAGMGAAAADVRQSLAATSARIAALRDRLESGILAAVPRSFVNGTTASRVPNTSNLSFEHVEGESLVIALDLEGIAVSTGSACSSGTLEPSHVLRAMGLSASRVQGAVRFSLGPGTTEREIEQVVAVLPRTVARLRQLGGAQR